MKTWRIISNFKSDNIVEILLRNRGLKTKKDIEEFLNPSLSEVSLKTVGINKQEIRKAVKRINDAIQKNEKIIIYGDYDADGICATAILWETIYKNYKNVFPFIPHRKEEGYGLSEEGIDNILKQNPDTKLVITVDNGIVANKPILYCAKKRIDVIVTDHHEKGKTKSKALAIVHTNKICGAAVAFFLAKQFKNQNQKIRITKDDEHLELVSLATVADMMPLLKSNRVFVKNGLESIRKTTRIGLKELIRETGIEKTQIGTYEIGHIIAPRINAMGRLGSAMDSLRMLCTTDNKKAIEFVLNLSKTNKERQLMTEETTGHAKLLTITNTSSKIIFVSHKEYDQGIIGLVASRLTDEYSKPSFVLSIGEKYSKGSARSVKGVNIIELIRSLPDYIIEAGGHPMAAGFTIETDRIEEFRKELEKRANETIKEELLRKIINIDLETEFKYLTKELYNEIRKFEPFGIGNPQPLFISKNVLVNDFRLVGANGKHLKLRIYESPKSNPKNQIMFDGIAFGMGNKASEINNGSKIDVVYSLEENEWNGNKKLQLKIRDLRVSD